MVATTAAAPRFIQTTEPTPTQRVRWAIRDTFTLTRRDLIRVSRQPEVLVFNVLIGVIFLLLFNYTFGPTIAAGAGLDYTQFLVAGVIVLTPLIGSSQTGVGLAEDLAEGVTDRFRSLPMSESAVLAGRTISDALRNVLAVAFVIGIGYALGFRYNDFLGALAGVALAIAMGFAFSWVNAAIAAALDSVEAVQMLGMLWLFPLMFISTVFTPAAPMADWLRPIAQNQPISTTTDAVRALAAGVPAGEPIVKTLVWIAGLLVVFIPLAAILMRRRG